jgi:hypothetical protein
LMCWRLRRALFFPLRFSARFSLKAARASGCSALCSWVFCASKGARKARARAKQERAQSKGARKARACAKQGRAQSKGARKAAAATPLRPRARLQWPCRVVHAVESKAVVHIEVAVSPHPFLDCADPVRANQTQLPALGLLPLEFCKCEHTCWLLIATNTWSG